MTEHGSCLILGVGPGLGASLARRFAKGGHPVAVAARHADKLDSIVREIRDAGGEARAYRCDATAEAEVIAFVDQAEAELGPAAAAIYNASGRVRKPIADLGTAEFVEAWQRGCLGGFLLGREAARRMLPRQRGSILFTGATAGVKAFAHSAAFAVGKFGLRALAESMARELQPKGIHVAHFVIDGGIGESGDASRLDPDDIAESYFQVHSQARSAWSTNVELRPWVETF